MVGTNDVLQNRLSQIPKNLALLVGEVEKYNPDAKILISTLKEILDPSSTQKSCN